MKFSGIGGQAVMEGVMMRNGNDYAIAVRLNDGSIHVDKKKTKGQEGIWYKIPIIRGICSFVSSLVIGMSTLMDSASYFEEEEPKALTEEEKKKKEKPFTIVKDKDVYVIKGDAVEKLFRMTNFNTEEAYERFSNKLRRMGIDEELEKMGIQDGDTVKIFDFEFEWTR